jgi:hypothetical protein
MAIPGKCPIHLPAYVPTALQVAISLIKSTFGKGITKPNPSGIGLPIGATLLGRATFLKFVSHP